jgi:hypothetical protein
MEGDMGKKPSEFSFSYADLMRLTGMDRNTVYQHKTRGSFDPGKLESVVRWIARHGTLSLRIRLLLDAIRVKGEIESRKGEGEKDKLLEQLLKYLAAD